MQRDRVNEIKQEFVQEYMMTEPFSNYVNMVGTNDVGLHEWYASGRHGFPRKTGEPCLEVRLREPLREGLEIPKIYRGLKVYIEVEEITLHDFTLV